MSDNALFAATLLDPAPAGDPPVADFSASPTFGVAPSTVQFTDLSTNTPTSWAWDFGDGVGTSTDQNPSYEYADAGAYDVELTATNAGGSDVETKVGYIEVGEPFVPGASTAKNYSQRHRRR